MKTFPHQLDTSISGQRNSSELAVKGYMCDTLGNEMGKSK